MPVKNRCSPKAELADTSLAFRGEILDMDLKTVLSDPGTLGCASRGSML